MSAKMIHRVHRVMLCIAALGCVLMLPRAVHAADLPSLDLEGTGNLSGSTAFPMGPLCVLHNHKLCGQLYRHPFRHAFYEGELRINAVHGAAARGGKGWMCDRNGERQTQYEYRHVERAILRAGVQRSIAPMVQPERHGANGGESPICWSGRGGIGNPGRGRPYSHSMRRDQKSFPG